MAGRQTLRQLAQIGCIGAMAWCFSDYCERLWTHPPLAANSHERHFGIFRRDGRPKPAALEWNEFPGYDSVVTDIKRLPDWSNVCKPQLFYDHSRENLARLFYFYKHWLTNQ